MPFDAGDFPDLPLPERGQTRANRRSIALWLFVLCGMIWVMVVLGGLTRLTGSGLSIMEWAPIAGTLPPLDHTQWEKLFHLYQQIPQYKLLNQGFGLAGFQRIFWLEFIHRLWGRLLGIAVLGPMAWFWWRGRLPRWLIARLIGFFLLGGLQGAVGWFMVSSGFFADATAVAPARLVIHLGLAVALYAMILWTALTVWPDAPPQGPDRPWLRRAVTLVVGLTALTILAGGFVAGTHAGFEYNSFPLMGGRLVPRGYARLHPFLRNLTQNLAAVQFDHRLLATLTAAATLAALGLALGPGVARRARQAVLVLAGFVALQYALGVSTLLLVVPVPLASAHQANAVLVLTVGLVALRRLRRGPGQPHGAQAGAADQETAAGSVPGDPAVVPPASRRRSP